MSFEEYPLRFEVLSAVSSGGMGRVDVARLLDVEPEVLVAVKRPHAHMSNDEDFARMFMEEARLTWAIQHPNVARLVGWGRDDESIYMATEFVSGGPLHEVARRGRKQGDAMPPALIAFVIARAADGLAAAHGLTFEDGSPCNIVHRDISPSNIMVGFDGRVKIIDFGVAKIAQGSNALRTATGVLKGKVPYMAPEYARGGVVDVSCDLYSLGVVLYELLCGHRPFSAEHDLELLRKVVEDPPPSLLDAVPGLDPDLAAFVHQLLAKTKQERPASARSISTVLDSYLLRQGLTHEQMERELSHYVARYAQGRSLQTRSTVAPHPHQRPPMEVGGATSNEPRPHTRAVTPAATEHHTRISSDSGVMSAGAGPLGERGPDGMPIAPAAGTNSALFVPPTTAAAPPQKVPFYLWIAMATGLFSLVIALSALVLVSSRGTPEGAPPMPPPGAAATGIGEPPRPATTTTVAPPAVTDTPPPVPASASAAPPPVVTAAPPATTTPPKSTAGGGTTPPVIRRAPPAGCTPMSFDYPRCLKK